MDFVCDGSPDCVYGSDEESHQCELPVQARLVEGNNATAGRLEVRHKGVWGTICDDNFGPEEGRVACRMLGFDTSTAIIHSEAAFNPGTGIMQNGLYVDPTPNMLNLTFRAHLDS